MIYAYMGSRERRGEGARMKPYDGASGEYLFLECSSLQDGGIMHGGMVG